MGIAQIAENLMKHHIELAGKHSKHTKYKTLLKALRELVIPTDGSVLPDGPYSTKFITQQIGVSRDALTGFIKDGFLVAYKLNGNQKTMVTKENLYKFVDWLQENYPDDGVDLESEDPRRRDNRGKA